MSRLPQPGSDNNTWGDILNEYLSVAHNTDGSLKDVPGDNLSDGTVAEAKLSTGVQTKLNRTVSKADVGLGDVDDTSDADKPVSDATQTALAAKADNNTVLHLAGSENVSGAKNFQGGLTINGTNVVVGSDTRLTDQRTPSDGSVTTAKIASGGLAPSAITGTALTQSSGDNRYGPVAGSDNWLRTWAADVDQMMRGTITRNGDGAPTGSAVTWPDGTAGTFSGTASSGFPGAIDSYTVTCAGSPAKTVTQPAVTRDAGGNVTNRPVLTIA